MAFLLDLLDTEIKAQMSLCVGTVLQFHKRVLSVGKFKSRRPSGQDIVEMFPSSLVILRMSADEHKKTY